MFSVVYFDQHLGAAYSIRLSIFCIFYSFSQDFQVKMMMIMKLIPRVTPLNAEELKV